MVLLEEWDKIFAKNENKKLKYFPKVVIAVPCWNEENTVQKTVESLLNLNYPKDCLQIYLVNDGSTDNSKNLIRDLKKNYPDINVYFSTDWLFWTSRSFYSKSFCQKS
jgi:glycosyltransferase involved in cell wall biosynthesis